MKIIFSFLFCFLFFSTSAQEADPDLDKVVEFPFTRSDVPNSDYPRLEKVEDEWVFPVMTIQGIEVGYGVESDNDFYLDFTRDEMYDIYMYVKNTTSIPIIYDNPDQTLAFLDFTGERIDYTDYNGRVYDEMRSNRCGFKAGMLENEKDGKQIMEPGEVYMWDFTIWRDAESAIEMALQRKFRALDVGVNVPVSYKSSLPQEIDYMVFKETMKDDNVVDYESNGYLYVSVKLPKKYVPLFSAYQIYKNDPPLPTNDGYTLIEDNLSYRFEIKQLDEAGNFEYRTTNKSANDLRPLRYDGLITLWFNERIKVDLYGVPKKMGIGKLEPNASYIENFKVELPKISGEVFEEKGKQSFRKYYKRYYVPTKAVIFKAKGAAAEAATFDANKVAINILYQNTSSSKTSGSLILKDGQLHEVPKGHVIKIEMSESDENFKMMTMPSYYAKQTYKKEKIDKWFGGKAGLFKAYFTNVPIELGKQYYFKMGVGELNATAINQEEWDQLLNNSSECVNKEPIVVTPK